MPTRIALAASPKVTTTTASENETAVAPAPVAKADAFEKLSGRAKTMLLEEASKEHTLIDFTKTTSGEGVALAVSGRLTEKVVLASGDALIDGDSRRSAAAAEGKTWTKLGVGLGGAVGAGAAIGSGVSASFGFAAGAQLSAVVATDKSLTMANLTGTLKDQGELAAVALDPLRLLADDHTPGTELMIQGTASASAGIGIGATSATRFATVNAGVSANLAKGAQYTKNVKVLGDGVVYVQVAKVKTTSGSITAGLDVRADVGGSGLVGKGGDQVEKKLQLTASVGAGMSSEKGLKLGGVFDLKTAEGRAAYIELMSANPLTLETSPEAAQALLTKMGQGAAYADATRTTGVNANLNVGGRELLAFASNKRSTEGVLLETGANGGLERTTLKEQEYSRTVRGALPRLTQGEERSVSMRVGSVTKNGEEQRAALMQLQVSDAKVTKEQQAELERLATTLGQQLPAATGTKGKGTMSVQLALTDENLATLASKSENDLKVAYSNAMATVQGREVPWRDETMGKKNTNYHFSPPLRTVKAEFVDGATGFESLHSTQDKDELDKRVRDYRTTTGRDLDADVGSYVSMTTFAEALTDAKGKDVKEWAPALGAIGRLPSGDVRTALVAIKEASGASVAGFDIDANGAKVSARGASPKSVAELVGPVLTPAIVN